MRVRAIIIEASDVSRENLSTFLAAVSATHTPAPAPAALPPPMPLNAALPPTPASDSGDRPVLGMAALPTGYRPPTPAASPPWRQQKPKRKYKSNKTPVYGEEAKPTTARVFECRDCGGTLPEGKDRRTGCPKCGKRNWQEIPARANASPAPEAACDEFNDDEE